MALKPLLRHPLHPSIIQFYTSRDPTYNTEDTSHPAIAADFIKRAATILPTHFASLVKMLDLRCGTGFVSYASRQRFWPDSIIHGIDISAASLEITKAEEAQLEKEGKWEMRFWKGSAVELDGLALGNRKLQRGSYGLITCCSAFPGDRAAVVKTWAEYLAPGSVLVGWGLRGGRALRGLLCR